MPAPEQENTEILRQVRAWLQQARQVTVLTGAGVSKYVVPAIGLIIVLFLLFCLLSWILRRRKRPHHMGWSLLAGTGVISAPVLGVLLFAPVRVFGPGTATMASLVVLFVLMGLLPIAGRVAEMVTSRGVRLPGP